MKTILLTVILLSGCQHPNTAAIQNYLNYQQREQHHRDRMKSQMRLPMRPVIIQKNQYQNPYDPTTGGNPYDPTGY